MAKKTEAKATKNKDLVIVESPTKARTITRILGSKYNVMSCMGHIVDLPRSKLGIDIENDFEPEYKIIKGKEKLANQLKKAAKAADTIFLATDPDREGEAISWHLQEMLTGKFNRSKKTTKNPLEGKTFKRVEFHEITKKAIEEAFSQTAELDTAKVNAQQARRVLDRVVGYLLSPFLWKKVCRGLSAGRVQSVALKFIVDREREIEAFVSKTFYYVDVYFEKDGIEFKTRLMRKDGKKLIIENKAEAEKIFEELKGKEFSVKSKKIAKAKRKPGPPFITSSLQQEAFRKLGYSTSRTMVVAQRLYEGIDVSSDGPTGLITYMRTDSFNISPEAKAGARECIKTIFGEEYVVEKDYVFKTKGTVQAAHEAIRPTQANYTPESIGPSLSNDEESLYTLIWKRFIASFMKEAEFERTQLVFECGGYEFNVTGSRIVFDGFLKVYPDKIKEEQIPHIDEGSVFKAADVRIEEKVTQPPARFNDASIVKLLEEKSIGRPSTYAPTMSTLIKRDYIKREKNSFAPTELGFVVTDLLAKYFITVMDENFTADMEGALDDVENTNRDWKKVIKDFYPQFKSNLDTAQESAEKELVSAGMICEKCGRDMVIRYSRKGRFISCSGYPECTHAISITTNVKCPECNEGELIERKNKKGQRFYGCSGFPKCRYTASKLPEPKTEPEIKTEIEEK